MNEAQCRMKCIDDLFFRTHNLLAFSFTFMAREAGWACHGVTGSRGQSSGSRLGMSRGHGVTAREAGWACLDIITHKLTRQ
jgi:hypothetical protein